MRVYKSEYKDRNGEQRQAAKWYVEFRDHNQIRRRVPAFTSKVASEEMVRNLVKLVGYYKATGGQTDPALTRWLCDLPQKVRNKLITIGLVDPQHVAVSKPLLDHLEDFRKSLDAKGCSTRHVELVAARAKRVVDACGFRFFADISASRVMSYLHELRTDTEVKRGISAQTSNFYLQAIKQFCRWMIKDRRANESPVAHLDGLNVKTDRRRDRRALSVDELRMMLATTRRGPERKGMTGPERAMLYRLAVETGLRAGELRSLTRSSFDLDGNPPTVTVAAAYSKRRREDTLPLRPELAQELQLFLAHMAPAVPVFKMPDRKQTGQMFRADIEATGISYRDDAGKVSDFHSLRHTFISNLAAGGVHPKVAQTLARHSTITLTMDRYTHSYHGEQTEALSVLPDLTVDGDQPVKKTGTDDDLPDPVLGSCWATNRGRDETGRGARRLINQKPRRSEDHDLPKDKSLSPVKINGGGGIRTHGDPKTTPVFKTGPFNRSGTPPAMPRKRRRLTRLAQSILIFQPYNFRLAGDSLAALTLLYANLISSVKRFLRRYQRSIRLETTAKQQPLRGGWPTAAATYMIC